MKIKRSKRIRKVLQFYKINHGIRAPYKVLLDGEFIQAALEGQIMIKEQIPKMMQDDKTVPYITKCVIDELRTKGSPYSGAVFIANTLDRLKCRHKGIKTVDECYSIFIGNNSKERVIMGIQEPTLRTKARETVGVPVFYLHGSVPVMEAPSDITLDNERQVAIQKTLVQGDEKKLVEAATPAATSGPTRKRKAKGPNPLSVKKPVRKPSLTPPSTLSPDLSELNGTENPSVDQNADVETPISADEPAPPSSSLLLTRKEKRRTRTRTRMQRLAARQASQVVPAPSEEMTLAREWLDDGDV